MGRSEPCDPLSSGCPIHANHGALVGRVGAFPPFLAGSKFKFLNAHQGPLQVMINDDILGDNSGFATVKVHVGCQED